MNKTLYIRKTALFFLLISCGQDLLESGVLGGACRLAPTPCDADLICVSGKCAVDASETPPRLSMVAELSARSLIANGEDEIEVQLLVNFESDDTPFTGELLLYTEPSGVGTLSASLLTVEDGFGVATYRSCDRRNDAICPEVMSFKLAQPASPTDVLFESVTFRQLSTTITSPTQIQTELCRASVGSHVGLTLPNSSSERTESSIDNSWTAQGDEFQISTTSLNMSLPVPSQRVDRYQALTPDMLQVAIAMPEEASEDGAQQSALSKCLTQGVWVGSQTLEFWSDDDAEGNRVSHALSIIEIDCVDDQDGYTVVRACTHGIQ